jgi:hypothetical protein
MKTIIIGVFLFLSVQTAFAEEASRYQAVPLSGETGVFVLDTREGHMWLWAFSLRGSALLYQGLSRGKAWVR